MWLLLLECQRWSWTFHVNVFIRFECRLFFLRFKLVVSPRVKNGDYTMWSAALRVPLTPLLQNQFLFVGWGGLKCLTAIGRWGKCNGRRKPDVTNAFILLRGSGTRGCKRFQNLWNEKRKLLKIDNNTLTDSKRQIETFSQGYWAPSNKPKNWTRHSAFNDSTKS